MVYRHDNTNWGDLLTGYNGKTITSDTIGNMLSDGTWTYTWEHGRELATMSNGSTTWTNTYNADGLRTKRTNGSTTYNYIYNGSSLSQMTVGSNTLYFAYDASGTPMSVTYNRTNYYYATNVQGDVTAILNTSGTAVVQYTYDAWGKILTTTGSMASTLGAHNPLRYRGYVYDTETTLYYLQSRYYSPAMGRFISGDIFTSTGQGLEGNNNFVYCGNNPVSRIDSLGTFWDTIFDVASLCCSVGEVIVNPTNVWSWVGLAGDIIDLVPLVSGVGETAKIIGATITITNKADNVTDTIKLVKASEFTEDAAKAIKNLDKVNGATRSTAATGRAIHAGYKTGYETVEKMTKEAVRGNNRIDFLDDAGKVIYELKPFNKNGLKAGIKQLRRYNNALGGNYSMVLEFY